MRRRAGGGRSPRGLGFLDPGDVARIAVPKDAGDTSYHGVRGANGVVVITTRRRD